MGGVEIFLQVATENKEHPTLGVNRRRVRGLGFHERWQETKHCFPFACQSSTPKDQPKQQAEVGSAKKMHTLKIST